MSMRRHRVKGASVLSETTYVPIELQEEGWWTNAPLPLNERVSPQ